jgi:hypothetical protein
VWRLERKKVNYERSISKEKVILMSSIEACGSKELVEMLSFSAPEQFLRAPVQRSELHQFLGWRVARGP